MDPSQSSSNVLATSSSFDFIQPYAGSLNGHPPQTSDMISHPPNSQKRNLESVNPEDNVDSDKAPAPVASEWKSDKVRAVTGPQQ